MIVRAENIGKSYGSVKALNNISFEAGEGEIFGFIGPDGAGKTTAFRILASLLIPDNGRAFIKGFDVVNDYRKVRTLIGYMPGQFSLYSDLTVEENLDFFAAVFGTSVEQNYHLIRDIYEQIEPFRTRLAGRLSGGMKQKLALSCALIHQPDVLILDEPTTGVDAVSRREFWDLLLGLKKRGITILVSTPYMDEASMCDRVALVQNGNILINNTPANVIKNFGNKIITLRSSDMYRLLTDMRNYQHTSEVYAFGASLHYSDKRTEPDLNDIRKYLELKRHEDISIDESEPGIEDVFMKLMKKN